MGSGASSVLSNWGQIPILSVTLFDWTEEEFLRITEGSPIRRIGHERWLRNVAVAMGNALHVVGGISEPARASIRASLVRRADHPGELVREHVQWALGR